jgi:hypothetical protein
MAGPMQGAGGQNSQAMKAEQPTGGQRALTHPHFSQEFGAAWRVGTHADAPACTVRKQRVETSLDTARKSEAAEKMAVSIRFGGSGAGEVG